MKMYAVFLLLALIAFTSCNTESHSKLVEFSSDLEQTNGDKFKTSSSMELKGAQFQSDLYAHSGNYAVKLDTVGQKALRGEIQNIQIGDEINVKVWRYAPGKNKGELFVKVGHNMIFKASEGNKKEGDWELLDINLLLPNEFKGEKVVWYVGSTGNDPVFFDDFSLRLKRNNGLIIQEHPQLPRINLELTDEDLEKLEAKRLAAIENGVLMSNSDDWIKTKVSWNDDTKKAKIRLKGDWTDHLYGQKFSIRVNVSKDKTLNAYSKFAIQNPVSRHYIDEWFVHQILFDENVLTTRYEFADLYINDQNKGLYAIEEHFTPEMLIAQGRKTGPIFKFSEDDIWHSRYINNRRETKGPSWYAGSVIDVFSQDDIIEDPDLLKDFYRGRELMYKFKFKQGKASEIVDAKKMAANLALMDICAGYHSTIWHNQRFYYDEKLDVLEPVVYDIFQESSRLSKEETIFLGLQYVENPRSYKVGTIDFLFQDEDFVHWYIYYLEKFTAPNYFDSIQSGLESKLSLYESEIHKEYDFYYFNLDFYHERAKNVRENLPEFKASITEMLKENREPSYGVFKNIEFYEPIKNISLHAYLHLLSGKTELQVQNFYYQEVKLVGLIENKTVVNLDEPIILPPYKDMRAPELIKIDINTIPESLIFTVNGSDSLYTQKVTRFRAPIEDEE
jgi:hypothetical protein